MSQETNFTAFDGEVEMVMGQNSLVHYLRRNIHSRIIRKSTHVVLYTGGIKPKFFKCLRDNLRES